MSLVRDTGTLKMCLVGSIKKRNLFYFGYRRDIMQSIKRTTITSRQQIEGKEEGEKKTTLGQVTSNFRNCRGFSVVWEFLSITECSVVCRRYKTAQVGVVR